MECKRDFTVLYNTADSASERNSDTRISLRFVEELVERAESWGLRKSYYVDRNVMPGKDIFEELDESIRSAKTILIVVTRGFLQNHWESFTAKVAFKSFLDLGESAFVVPILLGTNEHELPPYLKINHKGVYFSLDGDKRWIEEERMWHKIRQVITGQSGTPIPSNEENRGIQETQVPTGITTDGDDGIDCNVISTKQNEETHQKQTHLNQQQPTNHFTSESNDTDDPELQLAIEMSLLEMTKKSSSVSEKKTSYVSDQLRRTPDDLENDHPTSINIKKSTTPVDLKNKDDDAGYISSTMEWTGMKGIGTNTPEVLQAVTSGIRLAFNWFT